jgi:hypothetical protein
VQVKRQLANAGHHHPLPIIIIKLHVHGPVADQKLLNFFAVAMRQCLDLPQGVGPSRACCPPNWLLATPHHTTLQRFCSEVMRRRHVEGMECPTQTGQLSLHPNSTLTRIDVVKHWMLKWKPAGG